MMLLIAGCSSGGSGGPELDNACDRYLDAVWNVDLPVGGYLDGASVPEGADYERFRPFCVSRASALGLAPERIARCAAAFRGHAGGYNCADGCVNDSGRGICDLTLCSKTTISAEGGPCKGDFDCDEGTACAFQGPNQSRCERLARLGEPCLLDSQGTKVRRGCVPGLFCRDTCKPYPAVGEDCREIPRCRGAASCDQQTNACSAIERRAPGEACDPGTSCIDGVCMEGRCTEPIQDGQPCNLSGPMRTCRAFSACVDGVCVPIDKNPACRAGYGGDGNADGGP